VGGYSALGVRTILGAVNEFRGLYKNLVFLSAGVLDSAAFKEPSALDRVRERTETSLARYAALANRLGFPCVCRSAVGTDVVDLLETLCRQVSDEFPHVTFFAGQLVFRSPTWIEALLHNETAFALQRRLQAIGRTVVILPARID
jgi:hypothetical protein